MALKSERLEIVRKIAERKESEAALRLKTAQAQLDAERLQYEKVQDYYQDYLSKATKQAQVSIDELVRMRGFTHRLAASVEQINTHIGDTKITISQLQHEWGLLRHKRRVLEDLITTAKTEERAVADKNEQKGLDELITQRLFSKTQDNEL